MNKYKFKHRPKIKIPYMHLPTELLSIEEIEEKQRLLWNGIVENVKRTIKKGKI